MANRHSTVNGREMRAATALLLWLAMTFAFLVLALVGCKPGAPAPTEPAGEIGSGLTEETTTKAPPPASAPVPPAGG